MKVQRKRDDEPSRFFQAMTQERRRYGFVLERQCSLAKHYASFHEVALAALHPSVDKWREVAATREYLPQSVEDMFASRLRVSDTWNIFPLQSPPSQFIRQNVFFLATIVESERIYNVLTIRL